MRRQIFTTAVTLILLLLVGSCEKENDILKRNKKDQPGLDQALETRQTVVTPASYHFDDVFIGDIVSTTITVTNTSPFLGEEIVTFSLSGDECFTLSTNTEPGNVIGPVESVDFDIFFAPLSTGDFYSVFTFVNGGTYDVDIFGSGISPTPPPPTVLDLIQFLDLSEADGTITINNPAFSVMLDLALDFYDNGEMVQCCNKLQWIFDRSDGLPVPPDMIEGPSMEEFNTMVAEVMDDLGC